MPARRLVPQFLLLALVAACAGPTLTAQGAADDCVGKGLVGTYFEHLTSTRRDTGRAGLARLAPRQPLSEGHLLMIGSNTKAMTAMVAARLVDRGVIAWTTNVGASFPDFGGTIAEYKAVTLEQLLAHQGGVLSMQGSDQPLAFFAYVQGSALPLPTTEVGRRRFFAQWLLSQPLQAGVTPGSTFLYSNGGYALAGAMLEQATGKSIETLFDAELLQPLGLTGVWGRPALVSDAEPLGYSGVSRSTLAPAPLPTSDEQVWLDVLRPAGQFALPTAMYSRWLRWHLQALSGQDTPLPAGYLSRIRRLTEGQYAMGWGGSTTYQGRPRITHAGADGIEGFSTLAEVFVDGGDAAFAQSNTLAELTTVSSADPGWVFTAMKNALVAMRARYLP